MVTKSIHHPFSRYIVFIVVAIGFLFSYPFTVHALEDSIGPGWHTTIGRPPLTYLLPVWFVLIYFTYSRMETKGIRVPQWFFWLHLAITVIPTFFISYPFLIYYHAVMNSSTDPYNALHKINYATIAYYGVQVLFYCLLMAKYVFGDILTNRYTSSHQ